MWRQPTRVGDPQACTRISVTGTRDCYVVHEGGAPAVRVWVRGGTLRCECGIPRCRHVASLQAFGFVEDKIESVEAA